MAEGVFASDARRNFADIVYAISRSYDKADEVKFRIQTMTFLFGMGTSYLSCASLQLNDSIIAEYQVNCQIYLFWNSSGLEKIIVYLHFT